jgi:hypothetical protein
MSRRLLGLALFAFMAGNAQAAGWSSLVVTIVSYHTTTSGLLYLNTSTNENPDGCSTPSTLLISGDTAYKFVVATVMSAQSTGQAIQLYYSGCSGGGTTGYPLITSVAVPHL